MGWKLHFHAHLLVTDILKIHLYLCNFQMFQFLDTPDHEDHRDVRHDEPHGVRHDLRDDVHGRRDSNDKMKINP